MRIANLLLNELPGKLPANHRRDWVPGGYLGTAATIKRMREFTTQYKRDFELRKIAVSILRNCPAKDYHCYARTLYEFCRDKIKYVYDPHLVELVESPMRVLEAGAGDCDSVCTLLASMNEAVGLKTRFRTIKADPKRPSDFSHVYCMVRVPQSRFSKSRVFGWVAEDPTLPDKQFGWEPPGDFERKDWAASEDKDGEDGDDPLLGEGEFAMTQVSEAQAQVEIDELCRSMNQKMVDIMRKGLEWSDPRKANMVVIAVGRFNQLANGPGTPLQRLPAVRNGYAQWSPIVSAAAEATPSFGLPETHLSGYAPMGMGSLNAEVSDETYVNRLNTYINTVDWKYQNLKLSGGEQKYPGEMQNIAMGLYAMRNAASRLNELGAEATEREVYKLYKPTVETCTNVARKLDMKYPEGTFDAPKEGGGSWWEWITSPIKSLARATTGQTTGGGIPAVEPTPMKQFLTVPDASLPPGYKTITTAQGDMVVDEKGIIVGPAEKYPPDGRVAFPWLAVGLGTVAAVGAYYFLKRRKARV